MAILDTLNYHGRGLIDACELDVLVCSEDYEWDWLSTTISTTNLDDRPLPTFPMVAQILARSLLLGAPYARGFWVHGATTIREYLRSVEQFTMDGRAEEISCPTLLTVAENDPLAGGSQAFFDQLRCQKAIIHFSASDGAGDHCEMGNRSLLNRRVLDWLDDFLAP